MLSGQFLSIAENFIYTRTVTNTFHLFIDPENVPMVAHH